MGCIIRHTMKKLLILIVAISLFLHFYPQPELNKKSDEIMNIALETFSKFTDTKARINVDKINADLKSELYSFTEDEVNYLKKITRDSDSVETFYLNYCKEKNQNLNLHSVNLLKVCQTIGQYQKYF